MHNDVIGHKSLVKGVVKSGTQVYMTFFFKTPLKHNGPAPSRITIGYPAIITLPGLQEHA